MKSNPQRTGRRWRWPLALVLLAVGGAALAAGLAKDTVLYIRAKNTRLMPSTSLTAKPLKVLQPGAEVLYVAPDAKDPRWHRVNASGKVGLVFQSNLATTPPRQEDLSGSTANAAELKSYGSKGAAIKALGPGAIDYASKLGAAEVARKLAGAELLAQEVGEAQVAAHVKAAGLFPVVVAERGAR